MEVMGRIHECLPGVVIALWVCVAAYVLSALAMMSAGCRAVRVPASPGIDSSEEIGI